MREASGFEEIVNSKAKPLKDSSSGSPDVDKDTELAQMLQQEESRYSTRKKRQPVSYANELDSEIEELLKPVKKAKKHKKDVRASKKKESSPPAKAEPTHCENIRSMDFILRDSFVRFLKTHKLERTQEALGIAKDQDPTKANIFQEIFQWEDCLSTDLSATFSGASLARFREETCDILDRNPDLALKE
ncbi:hypothetical protein K493DRAFT_310653 [Basidiobolus meristosporus CBS 931.73]|uniref:Uncharacterized protein n=1 Tax=Basidiobolus meristosporus CBS 931.73 TaxID=1314790 RepID=A0A1Y1Z888_9FUNG|nr:hypothetical protein K493DRAFT_310653 [Basidiobolus meristosporus CBS 931.73]|eukprot:ORY06324.1 hypothetical protein K493DRAFT_310653 [Basidiobolus meristosporus CBS 931.73]